MIESQKINKAIIAQKACFPKIKKLAIFVSGRRKWLASQELVEILLKHDLIRTEKGVLHAYVDGMAFVFLGQEDEIVQKILALKPKVKRDTPLPEVVLIKMAVLRLVKLQAVIDESDEYVKKYNQASSAPSVIKEIGGLFLADLEDNLQRLKTISLQWQIKRHVEHMEAFIKKHKITLELLHKAWEQFCVIRVMTT